jgi:hypothetical protein
MPRRPRRLTPAKRHSEIVYSVLKFLGPTLPVGPKVRTLCVLLDGGVDANDYACFFGRGIFEPPLWRRPRLDPGL